MTAALCGWEAKNSSTSCLPAVGGNSAAIHCSIAATAAGDLAARKPSTISRATRQSGCWRAVGIATMPAPIKTPQWPASTDAILLKSIGQCILIALASEGGR